MKQSISRFLIMIVFSGMVLSLLAAIIWSWTRWARTRQPRTLSSILSFIGLTLATSCAVLALSSIADPGYMFGVTQPLGFQLSSAGLLFAVSGAFRPSSLRWHGLACAAGMFLFWFVSMATG